MKRVWKYTSALVLTLICVLTMETNAQALDFPTLDIQYDTESRAVIVTGVPMYDAAGTIQYALDGNIYLGKNIVGSFRYAPTSVPYHLPEQQGYIFAWDNAGFLAGSGTYTFRARLIAHPRGISGETLEKGPMQSISFDYWLPGEEPKVTVEVTLDGDGGTFLDNRGTDCFNARFSFEADTTLASSGYTIDRITAVGKDFRGWIAYDESGKALSGLMTTEEVLNYTIPKHNIRFVIQWDKREGYPVTAITYAALYNGTGQPSPNVRITLETGGVRYSGYGSVTVSKDVYSKWKGNVKVTLECPGEYIRANNRWIPDYFEWEGNVKTFIREGSCYNSVSQTGKGKEVISPRDVVNELFYSVRSAQPEIFREHDVSASVYTTSSAAAPQPTVTAVRLQSGSTYDASMTAMKKATLTDNVLVFDITAKDADGKDIHQLDGTAEVSISLPGEYTIRSGNTALVYYLPGDGTATPCETVYDAENHALTFKTDHFSLYAVAEVAKPPEAPTRPDTPADPPQPAAPQPPADPIAPPAPKPVPDTPPVGETPAQPTTPTEPVTPTDPVNPTQPAPGPPEAPVTPTEPVTPPAPKPMPEIPAAPETPTAPTPPAKPTAPTEPETPAGAAPSSLPTAAIAAATAVVIALAAVIILKKRRK